MPLMFAVGVMNPFGMILLTLFMLLEKNRRGTRKSSAKPPVFCYVFGVYGY